MPLSDTAVRTAKPKEAPYKKADDKGLYLLVKPAGKYWRFDYRHEGKRKTLALGVYPDVALAQARERRDEARKLLAQGIDPAGQRKAEKISASGAASFETIAREWFAKHAHAWAEAHANRLLSRLEKDVFPWIGSHPIEAVTAPGLLSVLRRIEARGAVETAHRVLQTCGQIFRYAIATGRAERDTAADLKGALPPVKGGNFAAVTDPKDAARLLRAIDAYQGTLAVQCALKLAPLVFVRPGGAAASRVGAYRLGRGRMALHRHPRPTFSTLSPWRPRPWPSCGSCSR